MGPQAKVVVWGNMGAHGLQSLLQAPTHTHGDMTTCPAVRSGGSGSHGLASGVSALRMNRRDRKGCTYKK